MYREAKADDTCNNNDKKKGIKKTLSDQANEYNSQQASNDVALKLNEVERRDDECTNDRFGVAARRDVHNERIQQPADGDAPERRARRKLAPQHGVQHPANQHIERNEQQLAKRRVQRNVGQQQIGAVWRPKNKRTTNITPDALNGRIAREPIKLLLLTAMVCSETCCACMVRGLGAGSAPRR